MTRAEGRPVQLSQASLAKELLARCPDAQAELVDMAADTACFLATRMQDADFWDWRDDKRAAFVGLVNAALRVLFLLGPSAENSTAEDVVAVARGIMDQMLRDAEPAGHA